MGTMEIRALPDFPGYFATDAGGIFSTNKKSRSSADCPLKGWSDPDGYQRVSLRKGGENHVRLAHRIILEAFKGPPPHGHVARHLDGSRTNNRPDNLQWSTQAENLSDRFLHGTIANGERHGRSKLTLLQVGEVRRLAASGVSNKEIAARYGVSRWAIYAIVKGINWRQPPPTASHRHATQRPRPPHHTAQSATGHPRRFGGVG